MKISLIGDFSSLHLNLKKGFEALGHECKLYSTGDGFKRIPGGIHYGPQKNGYWALAGWLVKQPEWLERQLLENDIVQLMNPYSLALPHRFGVQLYRSFLVGRLRDARRRSVSKFGLSVAGCSALTIKQMQNLDRSPCGGCMVDTGTENCVFELSENFEYETALYSLCDCVIPFGGCAYEKSATGLPALPMPVDHSSISYRENKVSGKIKILHGINRPGFKGSQPILNALRRIEKNFPNAEIVVVERLPFSEYLQVVSSCNIVVDQLYCDTFGMNTLLTMAMGRVVLTSHDADCVMKIYGDASPAIDIDSEDSVYDALAKVLKHWMSSDFVKRGRMSRGFIESNCDASRIAQRVLGYYQL